MKFHVTDGKIFLDRSPDEIKPLVQRLNRIEGQIRAVRTMIEEGRHCRDELELVNAATAALKQFGTVVAGQHLRAGLLCASEGKDTELALADLLDVLQTAIRRT